MCTSCVPQVRANRGSAPRGVWDSEKSFRHQRHSRVYRPGSSGGGGEAEKGSCDMDSDGGAGVRAAAASPEDLKAICRQLYALADLKLVCEDDATLSLFLLGHKWA